MIPGISARQTPDPAGEEFPPKRPGLAAAGRGTILVDMSDKPENAPPPDDPERPAEAFKKGLGLLWKAARSAADEIKREVQKGGVTDALQQAGRDLEDAANQAARALEGFIERAGGHKPEYTDRWPPPGSDVPGRGSENKSAQPENTPSEKAQQDKVQSKGEAGAPGSAPAAPEGGVDENGERRDMRIQIDD